MKTSIVVPKSLMSKLDEDLVIELNMDADGRKIVASFKSATSIPELALNPETLAVRYGDSEYSLTKRQFRAIQIIDESGGRIGASSFLERYLERSPKKTSASTELGGTLANLNKAYGNKNFPFRIEIENCFCVLKQVA